MRTDIATGTRICQYPGCGEKFDIGYGGGKAKYCPSCRVVVMEEEHREQGKRARKRRREEVERWKMVLKP